MQHSYGGAAGLQRLVDACHQRGLAVVLDVVYNHLGPEGNYLDEFGPYFTDRYQTPWGRALNFDGPDSDPVRHYFLSNALFWMRHFHLDGLRLDAIHGIIDLSAQPFLAELQQAAEQEAHRRGRRFWLFAESDLNDVRVLRPPEQGGFGIPAQWNDDFHHALHVELTGEQEGYYLDFEGLNHLAVALREGFVYRGQYSRHRRRRHGNSSAAYAPSRLVVFAQNHDQVGNRARGDRLSTLVDREALKLSAGLVLLSPCLPLLFMGEEYGEIAPFPYFTSHGDHALAEAVRRGRKQEFAAFRWRGEVPDPQAESTFAQARLHADLRAQPWHQALQHLYRELLCWRRQCPAFARLNWEEMEVGVWPGQRLLVIERGRHPEVQPMLLLFHFGRNRLQASATLPAGGWEKKLDSADGQWLGPGSPLNLELHSGGDAPTPFQMAASSFAVFQRK